MQSCYDCGVSQPNTQSITQYGRLYCAVCWYNNQIRDMNDDYIRQISTNPTAEEIAIIHILRAYAKNS